MLKFWKVEAIGNDFPLVRLDDVQASELPALAVTICDRHFGVGGDGLLAVGMEEGDVRLRMFNPDGTEDFCGNGLRCAARFAHDQSWVPESFAMRHLDRLVPTKIAGPLVSTRIGLVSYDPARIPVAFPEDAANAFDRVVWSDGAHILRGSSLSTGSTHTVIPGPIPDEETFQVLSPRIEVAPQFPQRTSVIWAETVAPMVLSIRIWERGVGETQGCGTGSSAAAIDHLRRTGQGGRVEVRNPGGTVWVDAESWAAPFTVTGEAVIVYCGEYASSSSS